MSKTPTEIAKAVLERRSRMTHIILPGEISAEIGPDGVAEALRNRWLVPDTDSGFLCATNDPGAVTEMHRVSGLNPEAYRPEAVSVAESHDLSLLHTRRSHALHEIAAPMTGAPSPGLASTAQPQPAPSGRPDPYAVGTAVTVARGGKPISGVIEKLLPDGRFQVGFANQPPQGGNVFSKEEVNAVPTSPERPTGTAAVGAAAP